MKITFLFSVQVEGQNKSEYVRVFEHSEDNLFLDRIESFLNEMRAIYNGSLAHLASRSCQSEK